MGLKLDKDAVKNKSRKKYSKTTKVSIMLGLVVVGVLALNFWSSYQLKQSVDIVKLKTSVPQDGVITQDIMVKDSMLKSEYEKQGVYELSDGTKKRAIVLWDDRERIKLAYASYYVRQGTPLYWDALSKETPKKYSYLYKMDGELLKIKVDAKEFGRMLVPGDKINVRTTYTENEYVLPNEQDFMLQQQMGIQPETNVTKTEKLFNSVVVLDLLNSKGESIFDIYYRLLALPKQQQTELMKDDEFMNTVQPIEVLVNVTPEEADRYMEVTNKSAKFMMTLLPRSSGSLITEALNELQIGFSRE